MSQIKYILIFLVPALCLSCGDDDALSAKELINAHPWKVNNYDVQASTSGISIPQEVLDPFINDILAEAPLRGTITFTPGVTVVEDQGVRLEGSWTLSDDETTFTITLGDPAETSTLLVLQITDDSYNLKYTITKDVEVEGNMVPVILDITVFLVPA